MRLLEMVIFCWQLGIEPKAASSENEANPSDNHFMQKTCKILGSCSVVDEVQVICDVM